MQRRQFLTLGPALAVAAAGVHAAADKGAEQSEVKTRAMQALQDFYQADPKLKDAVARAPGFAVFTTYGLSFGLGGAGGKGIARDAKTSKDTYMSIAQASAGLQIGASQTRYLFVFDNQQAFADFVDKGWDASAGAAAGAGAGGSAANVGAGAGNIQGGRMYALTKGGLQAGASVSGLKAWKDKDLN
ncbi:MAG: YSC84-related protein [Burkholderiales bacterium]